jgi:hypothetical protein
MPAPLGDHLATDASLHLLADHLTEALAEGELEPCLLHVATPDADGFDLGVKPLDGLHPTDALLGTTAPDDWHAVGIATHGWAYHVAERGDPGRRRHRVHVVTLLSRSGEHAHRVRADDEDLEEALGAEAPGGEQVDLLRRVLGLPTDPPPCDPSTYWSIEWLSALVRAEQPVETMAAAIELHPVTQLLRRGTSIGAPDLVDVLTAFHRVLTWGRMRELASLDRFTVPELDPEDAVWLDDGSFARFVLNRCPPLHLLKGRLDAHCSPDVADDVLDLLEDLGVPDTTWPDLVRRPRPAA